MIRASLVLDPVLFYSAGISIWGVCGYTKNICHVKQRGVRTSRAGEIRLFFLYYIKKKRWMTLYTTATVLAYNGNHFHVAIVFAQG